MTPTPQQNPLVSPMAGSAPPPAFSMLYVPGGAPRCRAHPPPRPKPCARSAALPRPPDPRPRAESRSKPHRSPTLPDLTRRRSAGGLRRSPDIETSRPADRATRHNPRRPHTQPLVISPPGKATRFLSGLGQSAQVRVAIAPRIDVRRRAVDSPAETAKMSHVPRAAIVPASDRSS